MLCFCFILRPFVYNDLVKTDAMRFLRNYFCEGLDARVFRRVCPAVDSVCVLLFSVLNCC